MLDFQFRRGGSFSDKTAAGGYDVIRVVCRLAEDDKYRSGGIKSQPHFGARVLRAPNRRGFNHARVGMPELGNLSADAERALGGIKLPALVGKKINVRLAGDAVRVCQLRMGRRAGEFKIRFQILRGENIGQRFTPDDAAFAFGIFKNTRAVAWTPKFVGEFFILRVALRKISEAW